MKRFLFGCAFLFLSCGTKDIGLVYARQYALRNANEVRQSWNDLLERQGVQAILTTVSIKRMRDVSSDAWIYYILAESADGKTRAVQRIERREKLFYPMKPVAQVVVCTDCDHGRFVWHSGWICENPFGEKACEPKAIPAMASLPEG